MNWSDNLLTLYRGIRLGTRVAKARLDKQRIEPRFVPPEAGRFFEIKSFGENPGRLRMLAYVPVGCSGGPLVVVLHGCGQDPAQFAADSGWIALADRLHIPLVLPQQAGANNADRCLQCVL